MLLIGCFANTIELEQALAVIEQSGIERRHILAVGMDLLTEKPEDSKKNDAVEVGTAWATACAVIGVAVGFRLAWGPIVWGLVGAAVGFCAGFCLQRLIRGGRPRPRDFAWLPEVTVIVQCPAHKSDDIRTVMYRSGALSVGKSGI